MMNGGLNGYMQTGTAEGYWRGMLSGAVPTGLGFDTAADSNSLYMTNGLVNFGVSLARDYIKGYIIGGKEGALRNVRYSLATNAIGHGMGLWFSGGKSPSFESGLWNYDVNKIPGGTRAMVMGNVGLFTEEFWAPSNGQRWAAHEIRHGTEQFGSLGGAYIPAHFFRTMGAESMENQPYLCPGYSDVNNGNYSGSGC
jgi:hypothetical protein